MADRTLTVNGQPFTFNRDRFAGVRTMTVTGKPLDDSTTSIQVTVAGHSDLDGIYTGSASTDSTWSQQGGNGQIVTSSYDSDSDSQTWFVNDSNDGDPSQGDSATNWSSTGASDRPWKANLPSTHAVKITPVPETITVDRTASVIDSDRKGESRPLLSKVVGGAAAAYSLRDLNDKQGNNKVVRVRRASDNEERDFLAKEVSNGTLEAWVNSGNGFVETWYDQSGNGNDATQATATEQPKIVDAGSLLTAGVTFDGDDTLSVSDPVITASSSGVFSAFSVQTVATSEAGYLYGNASTSNGTSFYAAVNKFTLSNKNSASLDNIPRSSGQNVLSAVYNNGDAGLLVNGAGTMTDAGTYGFASGTSDFVIGNRNGGTSAGTFLNGSIQEIIIYNSDQSANRLAIEANINNQYDIY